jgi:hypothetical protein
MVLWRRRLETHRYTLYWMLSDNQGSWQINKADFVITKITEGLNNNLFKITNEKKYLQTGHYYWIDKEFQ